jgi:hypothetical protein
MIGATNNFAYKMKKMRSGTICSNGCGKAEMKEIRRTEEMEREIDIRKNQL